MTDQNIIPTTACVYGRFNAETLTPETAETENRLRELGWNPSDFVGRTVLDIGCNCGVLTIYALLLGAKHVKAVDPTPASIEHLSKILDSHVDLNASVECITLDKLDPRQNRFDIVLFMEVMHWAVAQGMSIRDIVFRLWQLTGQTLFLEFPWSVEEPSIKAQTKLTSDTYSADAIFEELGKAFARVEIVSFMHYFGLAGAAKRVLVRAAAPRPEYIVTSSQTSTFSTFTLGERSSNYIAPILTKSGAQLFKRLSPHSAFCQMPLPSAEALMLEIARANPSCLVAPVLSNGVFIVESEKTRSIVLPLILRQRVNMTLFREAGVAEITGAILGLRRDLRGVEISASVRSEVSLRRNIGIDRSLIFSRYIDEPGSSELLQHLFENGLEAYDRDATQLCHCDLHQGNVILAADGSVRVVDIDGLAFGTAFTDGISAMIWAGAAADTFRAVVEMLEIEESRGCTKSDCGIAVLIVAHWLIAISVVQSVEAADCTRRASDGLLGLANWWQSRNQFDLFPK